MTYRDVLCCELVVIAQDLRICLYIWTIIAEEQKGEVNRMDDLISRQAAIDAVKTYWKKVVEDIPKGVGVEELTQLCNMALEHNANILKAIDQLPSAQPEPLTDKEQRIFLAAMGREEEVCKQVDEECKDCREPYEDSLVGVCHEIIRKVKAALWET